MKQFMRIDRSRSPLVVFKPNGFNPTAEQFEAYLRDFEKLFEAEEGRLYLLFDLTEAVAIDLAHLRKQIAFGKKMEATFRDRVWCTAIVLTNPILRGLINVVFAVAPPVRPYTTVAKFDAGVKWLHESKF
jgi:hypothetical protein